MNYINKTSFSTCNLSLQSTLYIEKAYFGSKWSFFSGSSRTGLSEMQARSGERVNGICPSCIAEIVNEWTLGPETVKMWLYSCHFLLNLTRITEYFTVLDGSNRKLYELEPS